MAEKIEHTVYDERTRDAVLELVRSRFDAANVHAVERLLDNPLRRERPAAGDVVLADGKAVLFSAMIAKRAHLDGKTYEVSAGGSFSKAETGCPGEYLLDVFDMVRSAGPSTDLMVGNTCIYRVARLAKMCGWTKGPSSWETTRYAVLSPVLFAALVVWRKVFRRAQPAAAPLRPSKPGKSYAAKEKWGVRREPRIDRTALDGFWRNYLSSCRGLVLSRTAEELDWLFGEFVSDGTAALLTLRSGEAVEGYVVVRRMADSPRRWRVMDLIALSDDAERLELLLRGAKRFLAREAGAITLEVTGFPNRVQPLLGRLFPFVRRGGHNPFAWIARRAASADRLKTALEDQKGWFFGPYDGDYSL